MALKSGTFESVTKVALEEIIMTHAKPSKFGFVLTREGFRELTNDLYDLVATSRTLKAAGDRIIQNGPPSGSRPTGASKRG